jgi:hypothetical protein
VADAGSGRPSCRDSSSIWNYNRKLFKLALAGADHACIEKSIKKFHCVSFVFI